jgi:hypothetical protein
MKDSIITRVRLLVIPLSLTCYNVKRISVLLHAYIIDTWIEIHDWLSIVVISSTFKEINLAPRMRFEFF